jgi:L,D-peptidoglycan transpeptidase YkuD (ErfK/YbiS/YcfS/YnhG family)
MIETALQLILVITPNWDSLTGQMHCFERDRADEPFAPCKPTIPIVVGQNGIAWGLGLHRFPENLPPERIKREGDRKAPAGIFHLGPIFIDSRFPLSNAFRLPVINATAHWEAVDDTSSKYYNQLIDTSAIEERDWNSSEGMHRDDELYHFGLVIQHNPLPAIPGMGSCIFMHSWRGNESGTYGCTALSPEDLLEVLSWLDLSKTPLIVQLPQEEFLLKRDLWHLPSF